MKMMNLSFKRGLNNKGMKGLALSPHLGLYLTFVKGDLIGDVYLRIPMRSLWSTTPQIAYGAANNPRGKKVDLAFHLSQQNFT
jgi:hypothetical protein